MGAERDHRVNHHRDHGDYRDREQRPEYLAPRGAEPGGRARPPERGQLGSQSRILGGKPPLYLGEHALLVH
jgi:hypothetical protein